MTPEEQLLLRLARVELTDDDRAAAVELSKRASWQRVAELARRGGIGGLLASHLGQFDAPLEVKRTMSAVALMIEDTNKRMVDVTLEVCTAAAREGLTLIPFKGAALNLGTPYNDLRLREQSDVDLLARPDQLDRLRELLRALGCRPGGKHEHSRRERHELRFAYGSERAPLLIELHWTPFFGAFQQRQANEAALAHAQLSERNGEPISLLDPPDTMISLALHLAVHRYREQLKWLVDVAELGRRLGDSLDAPELWRRADAIHVQRAVAYVFALARELLDAPLPPAPRRPGWMRLLRRLSPAERLVRSSRQPGWFVGTAVDLLSHDSLRYGLRSVTPRAFRP